MSGIGRRVILAAGLAGLARPAAASRHVFDARSGEFAFTAWQFGLLPVTGRFEVFSAELTIGRESLRVAVTVRTGAISLPVPGGAALLRGPDFFDAARYPEARFDGAAARGAEEVTLDGLLTLRGVTRPQRMRTRMPAAGGLVESRGTLRRSEFGMTARPGLISDSIDLIMQVRL